MDPHTGLAVGLLRKKRPDWTVASHLKSLRSLLEDLHRFTERTFQLGSWTSVTGEIFNDGYGKQSSFIHDLP